MKHDMYRVKVPATSANMGAGFDVMGVAVQMYNTITACETTGGLEIIVEDKNDKFIPKNENNMIYIAMKEVFDLLGYKPKGLKIIQDASIPVTRGLGSSSACIVGGMLLANAIAGAKLNRSEMVNMATKMEGHPDNVAPAILGGFVASAMDDGNVRYTKIRVPERVNFAVMVPDFQMSTKKARGVLPTSYEIADVVHNISRASLMALAFATGDFRNLPTAVKDKIHQPYRKNSIPAIDEIFREAVQNGAKGSYISGAGSTLMSIVLENEKEVFENKMRKFLGEMPGNFDFSILKADNYGAKIEKM